MVSQELGYLKYYISLTNYSVADEQIYRQAYFSLVPLG